MVAAVSVVIGAASVLTALYAAWLVVRNRLTDVPLLIACGVVELLLVGQTVVGVVELVATDRPVSVPVFVGYLLTALLVVPIGLLWGLLEHSRWGPAVVAAASLVVLVLLYRLSMVWAAGI